MAPGRSSRSATGVRLEFSPSKRLLCWLPSSGDSVGSTVSSLEKTDAFLLAGGYCLLSRQVRVIASPISTSEKDRLTRRFHHVVSKELQIYFKNV